ncbi:hypothetical protein SKAU_G00041140 [Synaphobranchus kaupii]|uniref:Uncharacterized protein n=1 Tax=Synaphobranchus kaupii TaxID=118154 RepID=A0A9Q1G172_SYNKA|nr:hypothetical protein SKAU_G00041140 [Synaphobranchus kaupii]
MRRIEDSARVFRGSLCTRRRSLENGSCLLGFHAGIIAWYKVLVLLMICKVAYLKSGIPEDNSVDEVGNPPARIGGYPTHRIPTVCSELLWPARTGGN